MSIHVHKSLHLGVHDTHAAIVHAHTYAISVIKRILIASCDNSLQHTCWCCHAYRIHADVVMLPEERYKNKRRNDDDEGPADDDQQVDRPKVVHLCGRTCRTHAWRSHL